MYRRISFVLLAVAALSLRVSPSQAAPRDAAANQKIEEAINVYYLPTDFDKAEALLRGVIEACEDRCSPGVKARAWMYVGIVQGSGRNNAAGAQQAFQQALALDPSVKLDDALATPETKEAFAAAAAALGQAAPAGTGAPAPSGNAEAPAAGGDTGAVPGNMECTPTVKQVEMQRPIPVACTTDEPAVKVTLRYLAFGAEQWALVPMNKKGEYWQGAIPCSDTGVTGKLRYYVQAKDKDGEELDSHGSKKEPAEIDVVTSTTEAPPAYPGQTAPQKCMSASECPPEMVGTPSCPTGGGGGGSARGTKGWGAPCDTSQECDTGLLCQQGDSGRTCETAPRCDSDSDCPEDAMCKAGTCDLRDEGGGSSSPSGPFKKNLVGLHFAADFAFLSGKDVCRDDPSFTCYYGSGAPFGQAGEQIPGGAGLGGNFNSGPALGTMRVLASYERLFSRHFGAEARVGFAFKGGPKAPDGTAFLPIHVELRAKFWIGKNLFTKKGLRPYVFLGGGLGQVDAKITVPVESTYQGRTGPETLDAYKKLGRFFVAGGGGAMYAVTPKHGVVLNLNIMYMLGNSGFVLEPSLGYELGF